MEHKKQIFVSYAPSDRNRVRPVVDAVRKHLKLLGAEVDLWMDVSELQPGESWVNSYSDALRSSFGVLIFLSQNALKSDWFRRELELTSINSTRLVVPVILEPYLELPHEIMQLQHVNLSHHLESESIDVEAIQIARAIHNHAISDISAYGQVDDAEVGEIAIGLAEELRQVGDTPDDDSPRRSVFVVHGHSELALERLEEYLLSLNIEPVILSRQTGPVQSLFQKFMAVAAKANFAVVLLGADDYGSSRVQYETDGVGDRALQFRSRQNVILELGFFYGKLGWENVFVVYEEPTEVFPNFERPSDLDGIVFDSISDLDWQVRLSEKLSGAGFNI